MALKLWSWPGQGPEAAAFVFLVPATAGRGRGEEQARWSRPGVELFGLDLFSVLLACFRLSLSPLSPRPDLTALWGGQVLGLAGRHPCLRSLFLRECGSQCTRVQGSEPAFVVV